MDLYNIPESGCKSDMCRLKWVLTNYTDNDQLRMKLDEMLKEYEGEPQFWISQTIYIASMFKYSDQKAICLEYLREKRTERSLMELAVFFYLMQKAKLIDGFETHPGGLEQAYIDTVGRERAKSFKTKDKQAVYKIEYNEGLPRLKARVKEMLLPYPDAYKLASKYL